MKKLTILLIALFGMIILIGCEGDSNEQDYVFGRQRAPYSVELLGADRNYDVHSFYLDLDVDRQFYMFLHQEKLHLFFREECEGTLNTYINLLTMDANGANMQVIYRTMLDESVDYFNFLGFEKHDDGYKTLVSTDHVILPPYTREDYFDGLWDFEIEYTYVYRRISPDGEIVFVAGIDALNNEERQIRISDLAFDLDGNAVASVSWLPAGFEFSSGLVVIPEGIEGQSFFLFDNGLTGDFHELEDLAYSNGLFNRTNDGQIIVKSHVWHHETDLIMFYEVDFANTSIIDGSVIGSDSQIGSISGVFPAPELSDFDFYLIANDRELIGYRSSDENFTSLIDFLQLGVPVNHGRLDRNSFLLWDDGRITIINMNWSASLGRVEVKLFLLTPSSEPLSTTTIEREIITLGGINVNYSPMIDQVTEFNRQSETHRIEILNYTNDDMDRLRTELIIGRGPDMFKLSWMGVDLVEALGEGYFILDLYEMIDADPDINREDFFPSILSTWENSRGELVQIAPNFGIQTVMGKQTVFPEAPENWNYADFISFYQEAREAGYDYPLGQDLDRLVIMEILLYADDTFFCERTAVANFDSESFINLLNFVMTIPADQGWNRVSHLALEGLWHPVSDFLRGEQLLLFWNISDPLDFRTLQTRLGGITAFGFPSNDAPAHAVQVGSGTAVGIRSNSPHIETAWEFVRLGLLHDASHDGLSIPLRIDLFEQLIYDELNRTESTETFSFGDSIQVPPLTETDAELLRNLISNIRLKPISKHPIIHIVNEDVSAFLAGTRSAEDTARIIQSRVSIFLAERER